MAIFTSSVMAMPGPCLRLLLVLLCLTHICCLNAAPITRTRNLMQRFQAPHQDMENTYLADKEKKWGVKTIIGRMDVELHDYPGSGANNRHTPKPPQGRSCADC